MIHGEVARLRENAERYRRLAKSTKRQVFIQVAIGMVNLGIGIGSVFIGGRPIGWLNITLGVAFGVFAYILIRSWRRNLDTAEKWDRMADDYAREFGVNPLR